MTKTKKTYEAEAKRLAAAIDIAIEAFEKHCPADFQPKHQAHFISTYKEWKVECLNPKPKFKKLASLKYQITAVFTYFQEATGPTVEFFWKRLAEEKLGYIRENQLAKILKRGRIKNQHEYHYVTDMLVVAEQVGLTNRQESEQLAEMLGEFENRKR